jgi:pimeloyl-ACP methyl ester carboxylesterase
MRLPALIALTVLTATPIASRAAERDITATNGEVHLAGTLDTAAAANAPVVLIVPGSGPTDRDGNNPMGVRAQPYKLLAASLNQRGITVARIDKRGLGGSKQAGVDGNAVTLEIYAKDVAAWVDTLRKETHAPCVWLLGHSEGSHVAEVAAIDTPHLCGLVLASAPSDPADVLLKTQLHDRLAGTPNAGLLPALDGAIDALKQGRRVDPAGLPPVGQKLFQPAVQGYLIAWFQHDPVSDLRRSHIPALVIGGSHDQQVAPESVAKLAAARPGVSSTVIDGMNHVWKDAPADREGGLKTYADPNLPVVKAFVDRVAAFVSRPAAHS